jgi:hypothetical protein
MYSGGLIYGATPAPGNWVCLWCLGDKADVRKDDPANDAGLAAEAVEFDGGLVPQVSRLGSARMAGRVPGRGTVSKDDLVAAGEATESRGACAGPARAGRADAGLVAAPSRDASDWARCSSRGDLFALTILKVHELADCWLTLPETQQLQARMMCCPNCHAAMLSCRRWKEYLR